MNRPLPHGAVFVESIPRCIAEFTKSGVYVAFAKTQCKAKCQPSSAGLLQMVGISHFGQIMITFGPDAAADHYS